MFPSNKFGIISRLLVVLCVLLCAGCLTAGRQLFGKLEPKPDTAPAEEKVSKPSDSETGPEKSAPPEKADAEGRDRPTLTKPRIPDSAPETPESTVSSERTERLIKPTTEPKQTPPERKFRSVKEAAIDKARNTAGISMIILCPFSYDGTWQVIMYGEDEPKPMVHEFVWNSTQGALESTMTYPATPIELESLRQKYRGMESCELLAYPRSTTEAQGPRPLEEERQVRADPGPAGLVRPAIPDPRRQPAPKPRVTDVEDLRVQPADPPAEIARDEQAVKDFLNRWKTVWERKDLDTYKGFYHPSFRSGRMVYDQFMDNKAKFFSKYQTIGVELDRISLKKVRGGYQVRFLQRFQGDAHQDTGWKTMTLVGDKNQGFKIISEEWSAQ